MKTYRIAIIGLGQRIAHVICAMKEMDWRLAILAAPDTISAV